MYSSTMVRGYFSITATCRNATSVSVYKKEIYIYIFEFKKWCSSLTLRVDQGTQGIGNLFRCPFSSGDSTNSTCLASPYP